MKHAALAFSLMIFGTLAHAKTICNVATGDAKAMVFDRILLSVDPEKNHVALVKRDGSSAQEINGLEFRSYEELKAADGQLLVAIGKQENNTYGVSVSRVKVARGSTNALPMEALAIGTVTNDHPLTLIVPKYNLSLWCFNQ